MVIFGHWISVNKMLSFDVISNYTKYNFKILWPISFFIINQTINFSFFFFLHLRYCTVKDTQKGQQPISPGSSFLETECQQSSRGNLGVVGSLFHDIRTHPSELSMC